MRTAAKPVDLGLTTEAIVQRDLDHARQQGFMRTFRSAASAESIPLALLLAVASRESGIGRLLDDNGVHPTGEWTIMGINPSAHPRFADAHSPTAHREGISYGASYLRRLRNKPYVDSWNGALVGYNAGPDDAQAAEQSGTYDKYTTGGDYVSDVQNRRRIFSDLVEPALSPGLMPDWFWNPPSGGGEGEQQAQKSASTGLLLGGAALLAGGGYAASRYLNGSDEG